ncbi:MAG: VOC family protein [Candidatus Bathyarchaeia archaeon]
MKIGHVTLLVKNFDEALNFYVEKIGFQKCRDDKFGKDMRWVTVSPKGQSDLELTFVLADTSEKLKSVGKQAGDHVFMTIQTDDCKRDYQAMKEKGVKFYGKPSQQMWGTEVVFEDLYGNLYDLIQRSKLPN